MAHDVFISHSSKDKIIADAVCAMLEQNRIRCWIAPRDITPGKEWGEAIIDAISGSRVMILIFSANANGSPQIRREVERAVNKEVVVVPLRIENVVPTKALEYFIGSVHWLDALTQPFEMHLEKLVRVVQGALGGTIDQRSIPGVQELHAAALDAMSSIPLESQIVAQDSRTQTKVLDPSLSVAQTRVGKRVWLSIVPAVVGVLVIVFAVLYFSRKPSATTPVAPSSSSSTSLATPSVLALDTEKDKLSYAFGMNKGANLKNHSIDVDPNGVARAAKDVLAGRDTLLTDEEAQVTIKQLQGDAQKKQDEKTPQARTENDKVAYAIGMDFGKFLQKLSVDIEPNVMAQGLKDGLSGNKPLLTDAEAKQLQNDAVFHAYEALARPGKAFLSANKTKPGVVTLASGLQYKILTKGRGPKPNASDTVVCNYRGTLINGAEFDSSYKRGQSARFPVTGVIKGWTQALQLMPVGSRWQLFIPSDLAYGATGAPPDIGPEATLIFDIDLISIQDKTK
jgi:FKBP-type peptidyl-prolyl cis-trans isomerase FklB